MKELFDSIPHLFTKAASYFLDKKLVVSHTETTLKEENFSARGTGLYMRCV